jgi:1-deoxy-D-xylulose-5-phosphate synthase
VVAVIGDGAMTAGMAFEALNHAGGMEPEPDLLVILNDNRMSISENVGGLTKMLGRHLRQPHAQQAARGRQEAVRRQAPAAARFMRRWEEHWKGMFVPSTLFEEMGFHYTGPIDGHDINGPGGHAAHAQDPEGPAAAACHHHQGQGLRTRRRRPDRLPRGWPLRPERGPGQEARAAAKPTYTEVFGDWLCDMAAADARSWGSRRPCAKARAWCASARNTRNAISMWPSPNSMR